MSEELMAFIGAGVGRACDRLTVRGGERVLGLGKRQRADQGRTRMRVVSARVLSRVVTRPGLLLPWSVHKTYSPSLRLLILCGGQRILCLDPEIWCTQVGSVSQPKPEANLWFCCIKNLNTNAISRYVVEGLV
jgi:hypothetical protein